MEVLGIEKYEWEALNKLLEEVYATVRKKDREDNECDIFRVLIIAVDRSRSVLGKTVPSVLSTQDRGHRQKHDCS